MCIEIVMALLFIAIILVGIFAPDPPSLSDEDLGVDDED
jgi:hypothetical protein